MHTVEVKRRMDESDIAEVSQLLHQALVADGHYPLGEHKWLDLVHGGRTGFAGFVAREPSNGPLVGYAQLSRGHDTWGVEVVIRPDHRKPDAEVGVSLLSAALREVAAEGGGHVHLWVPKPTADTDAMAETCGLHRGRDLYQMRRPLPVEGPPHRGGGHPACSGPASTSTPGSRSTTGPSPRTLNKGGGPSTPFSSERPSPGSTLPASSCTNATGGWPRRAGPRSTRTPIPRSVRST